MFVKDVHSVVERICDRLDLFELLFNLVLVRYILDDTCDILGIAFVGYRLNRRNTTPFTAWIRAVTLGNVPPFKRLPRVSNNCV